MSLVSAYESGAESENDEGKEVSEDENSNKSENDNSYEKIASDQPHEEPKSNNSNKIDSEENNSNQSANSIERRTISVNSRVEMEIVTEINKTSTEGLSVNKISPIDQPIQIESIYSIFLIMKLLIFSININ